MLLRHLCCYATYAVTPLEVGIITTEGVARVVRCFLFPPFFAPHHFAAFIKRRQRRGVRYSLLPWIHQKRIEENIWMFRFYRIVYRISVSRDSHGLRDFLAVRFQENYQMCFFSIRREISYVHIDCIGHIYIYIYIYTCIYSTRSH